MKKFLVLIFGFVVLLSANNFDKYFNYAQNYYWLTIDENIGSSVYLKTLKYIKLAQKENEKLKKNSTQYNINKIKLEKLKRELNGFYKIHEYTMNGFFPLLKFISTSFYFLPNKSRKYSLQKDSDLIAVEEASENLVSRTSKLNQYHIFFNSNNIKWNEIAFEKFNSDGSFYTHLIQEIDDVLNFNNNLIDNFYQNNINSDIINSLLNYIDKNIVFLVRLEKTPLENGDSYFTAYADAYNKNGVVKAKSSITFGYSIDMRWSWPWMIGLHILLFGLVLIVAYFYIKVYGTKKSDTFLIAIIAFLTGRILPWIIVPTIETFMPHGSLYILYTLWWIALVGIAIMIFPIYGMDLVYSKLSEYITLPNRAGKGGVIGFSSGAGIVGYLFVGYIFNFGTIIPFNTLFITFTLFSIATLISSYVVGLVLDPLYKISELNLLYFVVLNTILFITFLHGNFIWIDIISIIVIIASLIILFINKQKITTNIEVEEVKITNEKNTNVDIAKEIENPSFYKFNFYKGKK